VLVDAETLTKKPAFDHARLALSQVEAAAEGARRAEQPEKPVFVIGFLGGQEVVWLPHALRIIREEAPGGVEIMLSGQSSPELALTLMRGKMYSRAPFRSGGTPSLQAWPRRAFERSLDTPRLPLRALHPQRCERGTLGARNGGAARA